MIERLQNKQETPGRLLLRIEYPHGIFGLEVAWAHCGASRDSVSLMYIRGGWSSPAYNVTGDAENV